jgi:hypothetical protein
VKRTRAQLRGGLWPETRAQAHVPAELATAARRQAENAIAELLRLGVGVSLDGSGRARFKSAKTPPLAARLLIERLADSIEALLRERGADL